jgi:hypothetical protein
MRICAACKKPFDEVHPLDHMNDLITCYDLNWQRVVDGQFPVAYVVCVKRHTWREHCEESFKGEWINPHFPIEVPESKIEEAK